MAGIELKVSIGGGFDQCCGVIDDVHKLVEIIKAECPHRLMEAEQITEAIGEHLQDMVLLAENTEG